MIKKYILCERIISNTNPIQTNDKKKCTEIHTVFSYSTKNDSLTIIFFSKDNLKSRILYCLNNNYFEINL